MALTDAGGQCSSGPFPAPDLNSCPPLGQLSSRGVRMGTVQPGRHPPCPHLPGWTPGPSLQPCLFTPNSLLSALGLLGFHVGERAMLGPLS